MYQEALFAQDTPQKRHRQISRAKNDRTAPRTPPPYGRLATTPKTRTSELDCMPHVTYLGNMIREQTGTRDPPIARLLRETRLSRAERDKRYSLRQVALRCGITPAYLSRVERGEVSPPAEDTLVRLSRDLGADPDVVLAAAGKIASDLRDAILARPKLMASLIRNARHLPDDAVVEIEREIKDGNW